MPVPLNLTQLFTNNAVSLLASPISATSTSLTVMAGLGDLFPQPSGTGNDYFLITLEDEACAVQEIIKVTGRSGDVFIFSLADRGQEDTTPLAWTASHDADTLVDHRITAETLQRAFALPIASTLSGGIQVFDEGVALSTAATALNFTGAGVQVTGTGTSKTVTIPGVVLPELSILDEGNSVEASAESINFVGGGVTVTSTAGATTVTIPASTAGGITIEDNSVPVPVLADTLNFIGNVSITDFGARKQIDIGNTANQINGASPPVPTVIPAGGTISVSDGTYSNNSRGFKFYVTLFQPSTFNSASFEVMANISGNLATNSETVQFSRYGRVGFNFAGNVVIVLDTALKQIKLEWNNTETTSVEVMSIRIQHLA